MMTKDAYSAIQKLVDERKSGSYFTTAAAVEKFCASRQVEYHPLACDLVEAAYTPENETPPRQCRHVSTATRDAANEWLAAASAPAKAEAPDK